MSLVAFRKIQIGKETTRGTAVAATKRLIGTLSMTPEVTWHRPVDERASLAEFRRAVVTARSARLRYEGDATYEQIINFLAMALKGGVTPTQPDPTNAPNTYQWTFTPNLTSKNNQDSFTVEYGDDTQEWESTFVVVENLELGVALGEVVSLRADLFGRFPSKSTFTAGLSDPTVNEIVANDVRVYIDGSWSALGTTQKSNLVAGATIRFPTGLVPIKYADGSLDFSDLVEQRRHFELELDLAMGSDAITEYDAYVAGTSRAIRLEFTGSLIEASYNRKLTIDIFGKYTTAPELFGDRDGENLIRLQLSSHDDGNGNELSVAVINTESSL